MLSNWLTKLFQDQLPEGLVKRISIGLCLLPMWAGMLYIAANPEMSTAESVFLETAERLAESSQLNLSNLNYSGLNRHFYSMPLVSISSAPLVLRVALLRGWGLIFLLLTLILAYQLARKLFPGNSSLSLLVLAFLATNAQIFSNAISVGGQIFLFFLLTAFLYFLLELTDEVSAFDLAVCIGLVYLMTNVDPRMAVGVMVPLVFLTMITTLLIGHGDKLARYVPNTILARTAVALVAIGATAVIVQSNETARSLLGAPLSVISAIAGVTSAPKIIGHLSAYFSRPETIAAGFERLPQIGSYLFQLLGVLGATGVFVTIYRAVTEHVGVAGAAAEPVGPAVSADEPGALNFVFTWPSREWFGRINVPGLMAMVFVPLTVFDAAGAYAFPAQLTNGFLYILLVPLTALTALGLKRVYGFAPLRAPLLLALGVLLTLNISTILISALWS